MDGLFAADIPDAVEYAGIPSAPDYYNPEAVSTTIHGPVAANLLPSEESTPVSKTSYVSDLFNKVLDSQSAKDFVSAYARSRFGFTQQPTSAQGGKTQTSVGMANPPPMNWLVNPFSKIAQPNQNVPAAFPSLAGGAIILLGLLLALVLFRR